MPSERDFDVVVLGATSVTGRRVASYLADRGANWAAAGRDGGRIQDVLATEDTTAPATLIVDVGDTASVTEVARRTKVVLNLVGPYTYKAQPVIEACVAAGTHYVDLTGEIPFVSRMARRYDGAARESGAKIVQVCGFESIPPDFSVRLAAERAARSGQHLTDVDAVVEVLRLPPGMPRASDMISGGTFQSMADAATDDDAASITDPAALIGDDPARADAVRRVSPIRLRPRTSASGHVVTPMSPAAFINPAIIHRSAFLLAPDAPPFRYREGAAVPGPAALKPLRLAFAGALGSVQFPIAALGRTPPGVRRRAGALMRRALPKSGFGPSRDRLEPWRWRMTTVARTNAGERIEVTADGVGHPGYLTTARLMGEAGIALAEQGVTPGEGGHLTPAAALGVEDVDRYEQAGLTFRVTSPLSGEVDSIAYNA